MELEINIVPIQYEQSLIWTAIREKSAGRDEIENFLVYYEKSHHYSALTIDEHENYLYFKLLIKEALRNTRYDPPAELIHITIENYMRDYIREEIDSYD